MIFLTFCACILDADGWVDVEHYRNAKDDWLRTFLLFKHGIPPCGMLGRGSGWLDNVELYPAIHSF